MSLTDDYRHSPRPIPVPITSVEEYEAATARAQALEGAVEGSPEEAELAEINAAIMAWDQRNDDATSWS